MKRVYNEEESCSDKTGEEGLDETGEEERKCLAGEEHVRPLTGSFNQLQIQLFIQKPFTFFAGKFPVLPFSILSFPVVSLVVQLCSMNMISRLNLDLKHIGFVYKSPVLSTF